MGNHDVVDPAVALLSCLLHRLSFPRYYERHPVLTGDPPLAVHVFSVLQVDTLSTLGFEDDDGVAGVLVVGLLVVEREGWENDANADLESVVDV